MTGKYIRYNNIMVIISLLRILLALFHSMGVFFGLFTYLLSANYRNKTIDNYKLFCISESIKFKYVDCILNSIEVGKTVSEQLLFLLLTKKTIIKLIKTIKGIESINDINLSKKNIVFITPHFGCFEIIPLYLSTINPICVMYKKSKFKPVDFLFKKIRGRSNIETIPANFQGLKKLLKLLKINYFFGLLPDQVPNEGEGEWAPFFKKQAYTMHLLKKINQKRNCEYIFCLAKRLKFFGGFELSFYKGLENQGEPKMLNKEIENIIKTEPKQYLWSYNRYKNP